MRMKEMDEDAQGKFTQRLSMTYRQYGIPLEIRDDMATLIESMSLDEIEPEEEEIKGREIYDKIIAELNNLIKNRQFPLNLSLQTKAEEIQNRFRENPGDLVRNLKNCLIFERLLMDSINKESEFYMERGEYMEGSTKIAEAMRKIRLRSDHFEQNHQNLQTRTARFLKFYIDKEEKTAKIGKSMQGNVTEDQKRELLKQKTFLEQESEKETLAVYKSRKDAQEILVLLYDDVLQQVREVWKYLDLYEKQQKLNVLDIKMGPPEGAVKDLNDMFEAVNEMLIRILQYFDLVMDECKRIRIVDDPTPDILEQHKTLFCKEAEKHFDRIVVIDHHPHQILKISKGRSLTFAMTLRILGPVSLGLNVNIPIVTVNLHPEKDLPAELEPGREVSKGICTIHNASKVKAQFKASTKQLMVNFSSAQITSVKRPESRSRDERVTEIKYGMIFSISLNIAGRPRLIKKLSLPLILTSQSSQEWAAKGTLFWDAYFSDEQRQYFQDAPKVYWEQVADLMDRIFKGHTKRGLTKEQLDYLAQRVLGDNIVTEQDNFGKVAITKERFLKESLPNTNFSLWKWVYACLNLIRESLSKEWEKGLIMGFVSRDRANILLSKCPAGTFLLRFGTTKLHETQSATITAILAPVAVVAVRGGIRVSHMDANLTQQKLSRHDLARYLQLLQVQDPHNKDIKRQALTTLFPNLPFDEAFRDLLHASELSNENYDPIIDKPEVVIRDDDNQCFPMSPASPDSSVTSGASIYQDDTISSPYGIIPGVSGCGNDEDMMDRIQDTTPVEVEDLVPTLRINTSDDCDYTLQDASICGGATYHRSMQGVAQQQGDAHAFNQAPKRKCPSDTKRMQAYYQNNSIQTNGSNGQNVVGNTGYLPTSIRTMGSNSQQHIGMAQSGLMSQMATQGRFYDNVLPGSQSMNYNPNGLPDYTPQNAGNYAPQLAAATSPPYMQSATSPASCHSYNSGPVFPSQMSSPPPMGSPPHINKPHMSNSQIGSPQAMGSPQMGGSLSSHLSPLNADKTCESNFIQQTDSNMYQ